MKTVTLPPEEAIPENPLRTGHPGSFFHIFPETPPHNSRSINLRVTDS